MTAQRNVAEQQMQDYTEPSLSVVPVLIKVSDLHATDIFQKYPPADEHSAFVYEVLQH